MISDELVTEFSNEVQRSMHFLSAYGYTTQGAIRGNRESFGPHLVMTFESVNADRILEIVYIPNDTGRQEVAITRLMRRSEDRLSDFDLSTTQCMKIDARKVYDFDGKYSERLSGYLGEIATNLRVRYLDFLEGKKWESDKFDWQGLK